MKFAKSIWNLKINAEKTALAGKKPPVVYNTKQLVYFLCFFAQQCKTVL